MEDLKKRLEVYAEKLEDDEDYAMSEEMQEEFYALQEELEILGDLKLQKQFDRLCKEYENPDGVIGGAINDMFPDGDGEYDLD